MERLVEIAFYGCAISPRRFQQRRAGWSRGRQQSLDEAARLRGIEHDALAGFEGFHRGLARLRQHKAANRLPGKGGSPGYDGLVVGRNARDKTPDLWRSVRFGQRYHVGNVCRTCTQIKR